jgi:DNA repair protein RadC
MSERTFVFNKPITETELISTAKAALKSRLPEGPVMNSPQVVRDFLTLELATLEAECFYVLFLNSQHQMLKMDAVFNGTIDGASVYPREIVRRVISSNAAAVILAHNHPSGIAEPSQADRRITERIQQALALIDVRVLDHIVVSVGGTVSFAERGLL